MALDLDDDEDEMESFSSSRDRRRGGGASSDFSSFGNRAVKGSRARRPLDEEDEDEEDEDDMPAPRGRARGGRRPLDEEDDEEDEDEDEDMDEDDDDEDFGGRYSSRRSSGKSSKKKGKGGRYRGVSAATSGVKSMYWVELLLTANCFACTGVQGPAAIQARLPGEPCASAGPADAQHQHARGEGVGDRHQGQEDDARAQGVLQVRQKQASTI